MSKATQTAKAAGAVIYTRVSTGEQVEHGTSLETQREQGLREAGRLGLPVVAVCEDAGVSGAKYQTRPGIMEALRLIEGGAASVLIATKIDRIGRSARVILDIADRVEKAGGELVTGDVKFDNSPTGRFLRTIYAGMAEMEREAIRERTVGGKRRRAEEGQQPQRSRPPFGYHVVTNAEAAAGLYPPEMRGRYVFNEQTRPVARRIWDLYLGGKGLTPICRLLNAERVPTPGNGRRWLESTLRVILTNPAYKGQPVSGRQKCRSDETRIGKRHKFTGAPLTRPEVREPAPEGHRLALSAPALVTETEWAAVQAQLARGNRQRSGERRLVEMLSGQTVCPVCGGRTGIKYQQANGKKYRYLTCRQRLGSRTEPGERPCVGDVYPVEEVEAATLTALRAAWEHPAAVAAALDAYRLRESPPPADARAELRALDAALDTLKQEERELIAAQLAGMRAGASPDAYAEMFADLAARRKDLEDRRGALRTSARPARAGAASPDREVLLAALEDAWRVLTSPDVEGVVKRDLLMTVVAKVVCRKGGADVVFLPGAFGEVEATGEGAAEAGGLTTLHTTCIGISFRAGDFAYWRLRLPETHHCWFRIVSSSMM